MVAGRRIFPNISGWTRAPTQDNVSHHLSLLQIGESIRVRGPKGAFTHSQNMVRSFGMIAGGTGITPMLQIIREIMRGRATGDITEVDLIFANVNHEDILLKDNLDAITRDDTKIRIHYVLNYPPEGWTGGVGFVTGTMIDVSSIAFPKYPCSVLLKNMQQWLPKPAEDVTILLCGPPPMVGGMKKVTKSLDYQRARPVSRLEDQVFAFRARGPRLWGLA